MSLPPDADIRHTFIGASEGFWLLNERQYGLGCRRALAYRKTQTEPDFPEREEELTGEALAMHGRGVLQRGNLMESLVAKLYSEETGRTLRASSKLWRNPDHQLAACHLDRLILGTHEHLVGDLEIKTHGEGMFLNILRNGLPPGHLTQIHYAMFCTEHSWGSFAIMGVFGGLPVKWFDIQRDQSMCDIFAREVDAFWNLLAQGRMPEPLADPADSRCKTCAWRLQCRGELLDQEELERLTAEAAGKKALVSLQSEELDQALVDRALILSEIEALTNKDEEEPGALQLVDARIKELMAENDAALVNKHWKVYLSPSSYSGLDQQRLKQDEPEIYKKFFISKRATGNKTLRVYPVGEQR